MADEPAAQAPLNTPESKGKRSLRIVTGGGTRNPVPRRFSLATIKGCRSELASLYRLARNGQMDLSDACRLGYLVSAVAKLVTDGELEQRLVALEKAVSNRDVK